ncbi:G-protein gamma-like domain-containing protein [Cladochytrium replicatum]|nr:G-protein gamma-like domain-containing protein [Cladochytrium replicatum]
MLEQKLRRLIEHSMRLREQLDIRRITVSEASNSLVTFVTSTPDPLLPSVWGPVDKKDDPFAAPSGGCGDGCMVL